MLLIIKRANSEDLEYEVDAEDFDYVNQRTWRIKNYIKNQFYLKCNKRESDPEHWSKNMTLHRMIMDRYFDISGFDIDHMDGNVFNNKKSNLRLATERQNSINKSKRTNTKNKYIGVDITSVGTYHAHICVNQKYIGLGTYDNLEFAALARDQGARHFFKEFAKLNFPDNTDSVIDLDFYLNRERYQRLPKQL